MSEQINCLKLIIVRIGAALTNPAKMNNFWQLFSLLRLAAKIWLVSRY
jgi:hypothetical protein